MAKIFKRFESIKAFEAYVSSGTVQPYFEGHMASHSGSLSFCGTKDYEDANNRLLYGDNELMKKILEKGVYETAAKLQNYANRRIYSAAVVGCAPHVPNYISGSPNGMIRTHVVRQPSPVVTFGYNTAVSRCVSKEDIIRATAEMVSAIMILEAKGIRVNFYAVDYDYKGDTTVSYAIKIKTAGEYMDLLKMVYPMAHPSMNRRHKFRFTEVTPGVPKSFVHGYGYPGTNENMMKKHFAQHGLKLDRCFCFDTVEGKTAEQIAEMVCKP